ncbi:MAG: hypothetical protein K6T29_09010, partial [Peptococcaceae bacterium]|nr:hypothetical protein [Peptococcaceae bacterium]
HWAIPYIYAAYQAKLIQGNKHEEDKEVGGKTKTVTFYTFDPKASLTRSQAATLIYGLMKNQKKL